MIFNPRAPVTPWVGEEYVNPPEWRLPDERPNDPNDEDPAPRPDGPPGPDGGNGYPNGGGYPGGDPGGNNFN